MKKLPSLALIIFIACSGNPDTSKVEKLYTYDVEERLKELGIELVVPGKPVANYVNSVRTGNLVFMAGKGPKKADGTYVTGKVPSNWVGASPQIHKLIQGDILWEWKVIFLLPSR